MLINVRRGLPMRRTISFKAAALALVLVVALQAPVLAKEQSPMDVVRDQIATLFTRTDSLQSQINSIQLTPGPQGIPGVSGAPGTPGLQGPKGDTGTGLDANKLYTVFGTTVTVGPGVAMSTQASCRDTNDVLLNGGFALGSTDMSLLSSGTNTGTPGTVPASWGIAAVNKGTIPAFEVATATCVAID
jgi:hypothetical protein